MFADMTMLRKLMFLKAASGGNVVDDTATGNPVSFLTDIARPLKSLVIPFSDENGITGLSVWQGGKNLFDKTKGKTGYVWWQGSELVGYNEFKSSEKIPVVPNTKYTLTKDKTGQNQLQYFNKNGEYVDQDTSSLGYTVATITIPDNVYFVAFNIKITALDSAQFEAGKTASSYEEYKSITKYDVLFPDEAGTPTAGQLDIVSGVLTVTAPTAGTCQLAGEQITALVGDNTIWSDANGDCVVTFQKKG